MANKKITDLSELTAVASDDMLEIVDTSTGASMKISHGNLVGGHWATHTPTVTASSGTFTTVSGMNRYFTLHGKTRVIDGILYITSKGTADGSIYVTIPSGAAAAFGGGHWPVSGSCSIGAISAFLNVTESRIEILKYDLTTAIANYCSIRYFVIYELA